MSPTDFTTMMQSQHVDDANDSGDVDTDHTNANDSNDDVNDGENDDEGPPPPLLASLASARAVNTRVREFHFCRERGIEARLRVLTRGDGWTIPTPPEAPPPQCE